ncbi:uncharacterized protein [Gorilla gorilla gorilla]|uniref:uncharacterized protein n=1 Tax=Gorilla gorilla gorilla TaxID=9595 RepID=UPI002445974E|nr:uncharacterized protein LOC129534220 [Gorilla gorilla gorilla]
MERPLIGHLPGLFPEPRLCPCSCGCFLHWGSHREEPTVPLVELGNNSFLTLLPENDHSSFTNPAGTCLPKEMEPMRWLSLRCGPYAQHSPSLWAQLALGCLAPGLFPILGPGLCGPVGPKPTLSSSWVRSPGLLHPRLLHGLCRELHRGETGAICLLQTTPGSACPHSPLCSPLRGGEALRIRSALAWPPCFCCPLLFRPPDQTLVYLLLPGRTGGLVFHNLHNLQASSQLTVTPSWGSPPDPGLSWKPVMLLHHSPCPFVGPISQWCRDPAFLSCVCLLQNHEQLQGPGSAFPSVNLLIHQNTRERVTPKKY